MLLCLRDGEGMARSASHPFLLLGTRRAGGATSVWQEGLGAKGRFSQREGRTGVAGLQSQQRSTGWADGVRLLWGVRPGDGAGGHRQTRLLAGEVPHAARGTEEGQGRHSITRERD